MKTLLCATLAVLLVAAVTAQSSKQSDDASSIEGLIGKIHDVVSSLGGFEGTINKLGYITKLVEKGYTDKGIGGWMARNLIKLELSQLKEKAMDAEKDMINNLLDELESKAGLKTYSEPAESYILSEAVKKAIALIRDNMKQILDEISKAQKEHDEAAGAIGTDAMNKIMDRLAGLKDKLQGLGKKLIEKLTGRDKTAEVYGANGGIRMQAIQMPSESYVFSEMIKVAAEQLRERIFKYIEMIGEAKRAAQKEVGKNKQLAMEHLRKLTTRLQQLLADLKETLLGRKSTEELEKEIKDDDTADAVYAVQPMSSEHYVLDGVVKELIGKLRTKILEVIEELGKAKREAEKAAGETRDVMREHMTKLRNQLKKLTKDLTDAILGRKNKDELEKDLKEDNTVAVYAAQPSNLDPRLEALIHQIRAKIIQAVEALAKARQKVGELAGDTKEELAETKERLRKLTEEMKDALLGKKNAEQIEKELQESM